MNPLVSLVGDSDMNRIQESRRNTINVDALPSGRFTLAPLLLVATRVLGIWGSTPRDGPAFLHKSNQ